MIIKRKFSWRTSWLLGSIKCPEARNWVVPSQHNFHRVTSYGGRPQWRFGLLTGHREWFYLLRDQFLAELSNGHVGTRVADKWCLHRSTPSACRFAFVASARAQSARCRNNSPKTFNPRSPCSPSYLWLLPSLQHALSAEDFLLSNPPIALTLPVWLDHLDYQFYFNFDVSTVTCF